MKSIKQKLGHFSWDIAYGKYSSDILSDGLKGSAFDIVRNPFKNKWFADPFILEENDDLLRLLVEEFDYSVGRGRIARIDISKSINEIVDCSIILDLPTHLSFPVIYRKDGEVFVHPENSASGTSQIYRYDRESDRLVEPRLMVCDPLTDAVIRHEGQTYYLYATRIPDPNGGILHEYSSDTFWGPYRHEREIHYPNNTARMAGMFIEDNCSVIRPAQDCLGGYGNAVVMYKDHESLCRIAPTIYKYAGIHTFNIHNGAFVIDLKKYDYPLLYKFVKMIKK